MIVHVNPIWGLEGVLNQTCVGHTNIDMIVFRGGMIKQPIRKEGGLKTLHKGGQAENTCLQEVKISSFWAASLLTCHLRACPVLRVPRWPTSWLKELHEGFLKVAHTLRIGCTELKAVPHAGLGFQFLREQVRTTGTWRTLRGKKAQSGRNPSTIADRAG